MSKRFTDTNKYKKPFIRGLQGAYKLLWDFIYHDCNHAGIWIVDFEIAQIYVGLDMPVNKTDALKFFNKDKNRIIEVDKGERWFIPSFIEIQYGKLNHENRAHFSVIKILNKYKLLNKNNDLIISPLKGAKDKDMDKDMVMDNIDFGIFWNLYDKKVGKIEKIKSIWDKLTIETQQEILNYIPRYIESQPNNKFRKDPQTFFNNESWNDEIIGKQKQKRLGDSADENFNFK